jgi:hypothetical protein
MSKFSKLSAKRAMPLITEEELWDLLDFSYVTVRKIKQPRAEPWDNIDTTKITVRKTIDLLDPWAKLDQSKVTVRARVREPLQELH